MKSIKYIVYKEGDYYVSQCLNVDVSSFGTSVEGAVRNLKEAVELYFEENDTIENFIEINETMTGEILVNG